MKNQKKAARNPGQLFSYGNYGELTVYFCHVGNQFKNFV